MKCSKCDEAAVPKKDGSSSGYCAQCKRDYGREHYTKNKEYYLKKAAKGQLKLREIIRDLKHKPCSDCKNSYPYYVMDFDHRPGEIKVDEVATLMVKHVSLGAVLEEIAKCDLVCANCHRIRTFNRMSGTADPNLGLRS